MAALLLPLHPSAAAQSLKTFPGDAVKETGRVFTVPLNLNASTAKLSALIVASGFLLYSQDGQIRRLASKNQSYSADKISNVLEKFGNGGYEIAFLAGYGAAGRWRKNEYMQDTAILAAESFLAANAAGTFLKYSVGRFRPYSEDGKGRFKPFAMKSSATSFPSGHTISAFSVASVFAARADERWVKVLCYTLASGVAAQHIYSDKHWSSDVLVSAAIGTLVGRDVVYGNKKKTALTFFPSQHGLTVAYKF